jgi:hypothetical protein
MREIVTAIPILVLLSLVAAAQDQGRNSTRGTQTPPPPSTAGTAPVPQAPVGHRQPTQGGLPPSVRKEEDTTGRGAVDGLGPVPQICRNC